MFSIKWWINNWKQIRIVILSINFLILKSWVFFYNVVNKQSVYKTSIIRMRRVLFNNLKSECLKKSFIFMFMEVSNLISVKYWPLLNFKWNLKFRNILVFQKPKNKIISSSIKKEPFFSWLKKLIKQILNPTILHVIFLRAFWNFICSKHNC